MEPIKRIRDDDIIDGLNKKIIEINSLDQEIKNLKQDYEKKFKAFKGLKNPEKLNDHLKLKLFNASSLAENGQEIIQLCSTHNEIHKSYSNYCEKCKIINNEIETFIEQLNFDLNFLYSFQSKRTNTKFWIFNINEQKSKSASFKMDNPSECLHISAQIIELPKCKLFCYEPGRSKSHPFIIDAKTYQIIKKLPAGPGKWTKGGVYYNNSVFMFGGNNNGFAFNLAMKFNLNENRWVKIPKLMSGSDDCSCIIYKESILICGRDHRKIYRYDLNINSYSDIEVPWMRAQLKKTLLLADSKIYIITYNFDLDYSIIFCDNWEKNSWFGGGRLRFPFFEYWFIKYSKGSIYFWLTTKSYRICYTFSLKKKILEGFSKIEYLT